MHVPLVSLRTMTLLTPSESWLLLYPPLQERYLLSYAQVKKYRRLSSPST